MLRNITVGRYYPATSFIHRLDPRTKLAASLVFTVSVFFMNRPEMFVLPLAFTVFVALSSKVPFRYVMRGLGSVIAVILFSSLLVFAAKRTWVAPLCIFLRLVMLVVCSSYLTYTTTPMKLSNAVLKMTGSQDLAMIFCIAIRYIPVFCSSALALNEAVRLRCPEMKKASLTKKVKDSLSMLIPLFASALRTSAELGDSMEARFYGRGRRTTVQELKFTSLDLYALLLLVLYVVCVLGAFYVCKG